MCIKVSMCEYMMCITVCLRCIKLSHGIFVTCRLDMSRFVSVFITTGGVRIQATEPATSHHLHRHVIPLTYLLSLYFPAMVDTYMSSRKCFDAVDSCGKERQFDMVMLNLIYGSATKIAKVNKRGMLLLERVALYKIDTCSYRNANTSYNRKKSVFNNGAFMQVNSRNSHCESTSHIPVNCGVKSARLILIKSTEVTFVTDRIISSPQ